MHKAIRCMGKTGLYLLSAAVIVVLCIAVAGWLTLYQSLPEREGRVKAPGLTGKVVVTRDSAGVPEVIAPDSQSAWFAMGYLQGQERFFQMDLLRRSAAGELAALVGKSGLKLDRQRRIFQLREQAGHELTRLPPEQRQRLAVYSAGVNAGLRALKSRPFEYWILRTAPQPWRDEDSLLVIAAMYFDLQGNQPGREYARGWIASHNPQQSTFLLPTGSRWDTPLTGTVPAKATIPHSAPDWWGKRQPAEDKVVREEGMKGSNGWLIRRDGKAVLANDMHLGLTLPGIWYQAQITYPWQKTTLKQSGITLPGVPFLLSGSNGHIAWGFTNSYVDTFDWIAIDRRVKVVSQQATLSVNHGRPQAITIRSSEWGPVVSTPRGEMAMRWVMQLPDTLNLNLMALSETQYVASALAVGKQAGIPVQNLLVADSKGNIGWTLAGALPDRIQPGQQNSFPLSSSAENLWRALPLGPDLHPQRVNPPEGTIVTANNRLLYNAQGDRLGDGGADIGVRSYAIAQQLKQQQSADVRQMYHLQLDNRAWLAQVWRDWLLQSLGEHQPGEDAARSDMRRLLEEWNGNASADSVAYALISRWRDEVYSALFGKLDSQLVTQWPQASYRRANPRWDETLLTVMAAGSWVPDGASDWGDFTRQRLDSVWQSLGEGKMNWGDINRSNYQHPLAKSLPVVGQYLRSPAEPLSGDNNVIHVNRPAFGASERMVVSPGDEPHAILSLPVGQSGNPLSDWWLDRFSLWMQEKAQPLQPGQEAYRLTLEGK